MKKFKISSLWLVPLFAVLAACGGGGGGDSGSSTPATPTLRSIAITPQLGTMVVNATQSLTATGTYSDGSTKTMTGLTWATKSGGVTVAQVTSAGLVTAKGAGTETITATSTADNITASTNVTVITPWTQISAGGNQTIGLKADGRLYSWGSNIRGQLGDNSSANRNTPVTVAGNSVIWKQISVGDRFAVAIRTDGTLWAWGYNNNGQLGLGDQLDRLVPTQVGSAKDWSYVSAGRSHVVALRTTTSSTTSVSALWAWGGNFSGQLGDGKNVDLLVPTRIGTDSWLTVAAGDSHTLAVKKSDQTLWSWGDNAFGQLGNGTSAGAFNTPTQVGTSTWSAVGAGSFHSLGIRSDGSLFTWGAGESGQLGNNSTSLQSSPVQIGTESRWTQVDGGVSHTIGVRNDGTLWAWGSGAEGQLGENVANSLLPLQIGADNTWKSVAAGANHSAALKADGSSLTLWTWGRNVEGQLGNGSNNGASTPVNIAF